MGKMRGFAAFACAAMMLSEGCSTTVPGTAVAPPTVSAKLDTGNYPTEPRTVTAQNDADRWHQEGWRVGDAVVNPWDIDPELTTGQSGTGPVFDLRFFGVKAGECILAGQQLAALGQTPLLTGFLARTSSVDRQRGLTVGLLRFADDGAARRAGQALGESSKATCGTKVVRTDVRAIGTGLLALAATYVEGVSTPDTPTLDRITEAALKAQVAKANVYAPSVSAATVDMDLDGIMSRTLAVTVPDTVFGLSGQVGVLDGWMSGHTYALGTPGARHYQGLQLVGSSAPLTNVLRFKDEASAAVVFKTITGNGAARVNTIPGIGAENGGCVTESNQSYCTVRLGRYVTQVYASSSEAQTKQAAAAAYVILKAAGDK